MNKTNSIISIGIILGGLALIALLLYPSYREYERNKKIDSEIEKLSNEAQRLREGNIALTEKIEYFKTEAYKEKIAKERLNMQKNDEQVVIVKPSVSKMEIEDIPSKNEDSQNDSDSISYPIYRKWINYFFDNL
jgi:cell division protein FtsB